MDPQGQTAISAEGDSRRQVETDPYSWVMSRLMSALDEGHEHQGAMNDREYEILMGIRQFIVTQDPGVEGIRRITWGRHAPHGISSGARY